MSDDEYTENPVYQATWSALCGDTRLEPNRCNQSDPRWSDENERLDLPAQWPTFPSSQRSNEGSDTGSL